LLVAVGAAVLAALTLLWAVVLAAVAVVGLECLSPHSKRRTLRLLKPSRLVLLALRGRLASLRLAALLPVRAGAVA
jgi:hypothetical protein